MTSDDLDAFVARTVALGELFDVKFSTGRMSLYFEALRDLPFEDVVRAMNVAAQTCKFLPKPAELRVIILGDEDDAVEAAWMLFRNAMERHGAYASVITLDAALGETVRTMFRSWPQACATELSQEMWAAKRKEWGRVYPMLRRRPSPTPAYLPGLTELSNGTRTDWAKYTKVVLIDGMNVRALAPAEVEHYRALLAPAPAMTQIEAL